MPIDTTPSQSPDDPEASVRQATNDADILGQPAGQHTAWPALGRLQSGAMVYSSDGAQVAVVDIVAPGRVTVRAGFPGRPLDLPTDAVVSVSPDGQRLDIHLSERDVEQLVGQYQPGYAYLQAQQAATLHDRHSEQPEPAPDASPDASATPEAEPPRTAHS